MEPDLTLTEVTSRVGKDGIRRKAGHLESEGLTLITSHRRESQV